MKKFQHFIQTGLMTWMKWEVFIIHKVYVYYQSPMNRVEKVQLFGGRQALILSMPWENYQVDLMKIINSDEVHSSFEDFYEKT